MRTPLHPEQFYSGSIYVPLKCGHLYKYSVNRDIGTKILLRDPIHHQFYDIVLMHLRNKDTSAFRALYGEMWTSNFFFEDTGLSTLILGVLLYSK